MSGIVLSVDSRTDGGKYHFDKALSSFCFGDLIVKSRYQKGKVNAALLSTHDSEGSSTYDKDLKLFVIVDGYFVENLGSPKSSAEWFLHNYKTRGQRFLTELNGSYCILLINERTDDIKVINDRFGTRPLFYTVSRDVLAVSPFANLINELGVVKKELNESMVANQLSYSRVWLNNATFFKGILSLSASSCLEWSNVGGGRAHKITPPVAASGYYHGDVNELAETFRTVVSDFSNLNSVGLSLSGGLDSRILLAAGFKGPTFTWGYQENNDEISLAKRTAQITRNDWSFIKLSPEDFLDRSCVGDRFREGLDIFVQSHSLKGYPETKKHGINGLITGLALDFTMAGSYDIDCNVGELDAEIMFQYLCSKSQCFTSAEQALLINRDSIRSEVHDLTDIIRGEVNWETDARRTESIRNFFFEYRVRRCIFQRQQWQRAFVEDYIPTFDNRLIDNLGSFSPSDLKDHSIFVKVLKLLSPELMGVPYQGTMLPVDAPKRYWKDSIRIENEREQMYRDIYAETNGKVFIPYNRYYSNFDEWLRVNPHWIDYTKKMLLSEETVISNYCDIGIVREWLEAQRSGKKAYFSKIIQLMSLEKTLRAHFV